MQLCTSIDLYFDGQDLVSSWTLGAAAYNILRDLKRRKGLNDMLLKHQLPDVVPAQMRSAIIAKINEYENFFKHADKDSGASLSFNPNGRIELLLFDAANSFWQLSGRETGEMVLARMWFLANACIEHDGGDDMKRYLFMVRRRAGEKPAEYRIRLWPAALLEAACSLRGSE